MVGYALNKNGILVDAQSSLHQQDEFLNVYSVNSHFSINKHTTEHAKKHLSGFVDISFITSIQMKRKKQK